MKHPAIEVMEPMSTFLQRTGGLFIAWLGTITIGQLQDTIGAISGLVLVGYTLHKWRALRRWELDRKALMAQADAARVERPVSPTEPGAL